MDYKKIILGIVIIVILIFLYYWIFNDAGKKTLFRLKDANSSATISNEKILPSSIFSWSFWVYVKEYTTKFSEPKDIILVQNGTKKNVSVYLKPNVNDLVVTLATGEKSEPTYESVEVNRFPIQKWTHVLVSHRNRAVDVYIDGKIVKSTIFSKPYVIPTQDSQSVLMNPTPKQVMPVATTNDSLRGAAETNETAGYNGFLATMQYFSRAVQPEESYAIYKAGYNGGNWLSDLFNKYRLKIAFMEDSNEINSFVL